MVECVFYQIGVEKWQINHTLRCMSGAESRLKKYSPKQLNTPLVWRILLEQLDSKFDVSTITLACCVLYNFCQIAGEENDDHELLQRVRTRQAF